LGVVFSVVRAAATVATAFIAADFRVVVLVLILVVFLVCIVWN
jgi:hypothetical protein